MCVESALCLISPANLNSSHHVGDRCSRLRALRDSWRGGANCSRTLYRGVRLAITLTPAPNSITVLRALIQLCSWPTIISHRSVRFQSLRAIRLDRYFQIWVERGF